MRATSKCPDHNIFPSVLKSCTSLMDLKLSVSIHGCIICLGLESDFYTGNGLMNMYYKLQTTDKIDRPESYTTNIFEY
uniref:Uncharacterized protein n=1 Tax=Nelumbo nucifera TaxID=4432 RepID=A0A822Y1B1_NELNU|nr:TPA_asm: hypothetical protein HUJ06_027241 [Nelumbo nucifera]